MIQPDRPLLEIAFHCQRQDGGCGSRFKSSQYETSACPDRDWHPYHHAATCPKCGELAGQAAWQLAAWRSATIPKSPDARARIAAANANRDASSYAVSRFNALTHGATAETAKYYPARPGKYGVCEACEYLLDGCGTSFKHCAKRTELFLRFTLAQESGDGSLLGSLMASTQAGVMAITQDMVRDIAARGVSIETPQWTRTEKGIEVAKYKDSDGNERLLTKLEAHPLLFPLIAMLQKNTMTLGDMGLTPRAKEEEKMLQGYLDSKSASRETIDQAVKHQQQMVNQLMQIVGGNIIDADAIEVVTDA